MGRDKRIIAAWLGKDRQGRARLGEARPGMARLGRARQGMGLDGAGKSALSGQLEATDCDLSKLSLFVIRNNRGGARGRGLMQAPSSFERIEKGLINETD